MQDHDLPFDVDDQQPAKPYRYKFGVTTVEWEDLDIVAFHASVKYVEVVLPNEQRRPLLEQPLKELIDDPRYSNDFIQIHRATLVRLSSVERLYRTVSGGPYVVVMHDGLTFPVSRRFVPSTRRALEGRQQP